MSLRITEIFFSLQGEARTVGRPTVFIRLTGCPLRCVWCDTEYSFQGGERMSLEQVLAQVAEHPTPYVTVTGGEPLAQPECLPLMQALCDKGYQVSLETSRSEERRVGKGSRRQPGWRSSEQRQHDSDRAAD